MPSPTDEQLAALRRRAAQGWPTSQDLTDALEWLDAEREESARRLEMLNRANAGEAQQIIRAETAEASLADIKRAIENSELLGAVVDFGKLFEDVGLEQMRWTLKSQVATAQRWAEWFAAERDWLATINSELIVRLDAVQQLFAGGPDTECRTTYPDGVECCEVPLESLRHALDGRGE